MTYNKETREELINDEIVEDLKRDEITEKAREYDDGVFDTWIGENKEDLISEFIDENSTDWREFCKTKWNEANE